MAGPFRGEIWNADLDPTRGREQAGKRPVIVVSTDRFNEGPAELVVVLPITSKEKGIPWHVPLAAGGGTGLKTASFAMVEAVRCVSRERLSKRLGDAPGAALDEIEKRLRILLEL
jgi:mRNA interferase MazF